MQKKDSEKSEMHFKTHQDCLTLTGLTFGQLPGDHSIGRRSQYPKGSYLWKADNIDHNLYFLERGQVVIMLDDEAGCEVIIRVIEPDEPFGELCFCSARDQPRKNCAQASVDSLVVQIGFDDFMSYLRADGGALLAFTCTFCERLADAESRIEVLSHRGAEARLGRLLVQLATAGGRSSLNRQGELQLSVGHDNLARMAAMTRPHVSVTMGKLRKRGLVHYDRSNQLTVDVARLTEYVLKTSKGDRKP